MLDKLRKQAKKKLKENEDNEELLLKYKNINNILKEDNCFFKMDVNIAIGILQDLGYENKDAFKMYIKLTSKKEYLGV